MSILTEKEREDVYKYWLKSTTLTDEDGLIQITERAVLERLAGMELPPVPNLTQEEKEFLHYNPNTSDLVDFVQGHAAAYGRQAYAQGAASQLHQEPALIIREGDSDIIPVGTKLYTLKEAK